MSRCLALTVTAILALTVASCGGDDESSSSEPATTDAPDSTEPASSEPDDALVGGIEVDDDPVCQAFGRLYAASFFTAALAGGFGADDGAAEKIEFSFASALAPVAVVIRTQGPTEFQAFPRLARVDAGNVALAAGGFTDEVLAALAASGDDAIDGILAGSGLGDLADIGPVPGAETKLAAAAEAYLAAVGTIDEFLGATADPVADAAGLEKLTAQCPMLLASVASR